MPSRAIFLMVMSRVDLRAAGAFLRGGFSVRRARGARPTLPLDKRSFADARAAV